MWQKLVISLFVLAAIFALPAPAYAAASCDSLSVVSGNNRFVPATVSFHARASDTSGAIQGYRFYFGDGSQSDATSPDITHTYNASGTFTVRADLKDAQGVWQTVPSCQAIFSLLESPLESQKSGCSNVFILGNNYVPASTDVKFLVTGFDNKSGIKGYKIDFGNGQIKQSDTGTFDLTFPTPGTFTVKGYITDSKSVVKGGTDACQTPLYITGQPLATQPDTGTPTWFTVAGILSGVWLFYILKKRSSHR